MKINDWFKAENAKLREKAHKRLAAAGICIGAVVIRQSDSVYFRVTRIHFEGISSFGGFISIYGIRYTHDGWGKHVHSIGFPEGIRVTK